MLCIPVAKLDKQPPVNNLFLALYIAVLLVKCRKMNSSSREKAAAASAESQEVHVTDPASEPDSETIEKTAEAHLEAAQSGINPSLVPPEFDLNDFDDEFDDDFEAETPGEYELDDDEYARALLDIVDFEIEGLEAYRDDE